MRKRIKKYLVPHAENDYRPDLFRLSGAIFTLLLITGIFALSNIYREVLKNSDYMASVLPAVLVDLANTDRASSSLHPLALNSKLEAAAQMKADDMAKESYFSHYSPEGISPWYWIKKAGYAFVYAGENLAINFDDSAAVNSAWMNSPGHRANILSEHFTEIGIATEKGIYEGKETIFVVQMFGSPAAILPVIDTSKLTQTSSTTSNQIKATTTVQKENNLVPIASTTSSVLGESEKQIFLAVKDASATIATLSQLPDGKNSNYSNSVERLALNPAKMLSIIYGLFILILLTGLILVLKKNQKHRLSRIIYILLLFIFISGLLFLYYYTAESGTGVIVV